MSVYHGRSHRSRRYNLCFRIESISKVHTAVLILKQYGAEAVLKKIGADATGFPSTPSWQSYWKRIIRVPLGQCRRYQCR
ncbi:MAG: glutaminase [Odoribacter splanchnicus]